MESKEIGTIGETVFSLKAIKYGLDLSRPVIDSLKYDFIVDADKIHKVQIKTTSQQLKNRKNVYKFSVGYGSTGKKTYTKNTVDFIVLYILPLDIFYIIPVEKISSLNIRVYPLNNNHKYSQYKEAWYLFK